MESNKAVLRVDLKVDKKDAMNVALKADKMDEMMVAYLVL